MTLTATSVTTIPDATMTAVVRFLLSPSKGQETTVPRRYRKQQAPVPVDLRVIFRWSISSAYCQLGHMDPVPFWTGFCQLLRCNYLLWQAGDIAQPEICPINLLYDDLPERRGGVMIDFDVATGSEDAALQSDDSAHAAEEQPANVTAKAASERAPARMPGSMIFMPQDIVIAPMNPITRGYRHDLESFTWCLIWGCLKPEERERILKRRWFQFNELMDVRENDWFGRKYGPRTQPSFGMFFDGGKWGYRMNILVGRLLRFWLEEVPHAIKLGQLREGITTRRDAGESLKDPFAEIASGPVLGGWVDEEEERKWITEKFAAILRETGLPLGFEIAELDPASPLPGEGRT